MNSHSESKIDEVSTTPLTSKVPKGIFNTPPAFSIAVLADRTDRSDSLFDVIMTESIFDLEAKSKLASLNRGLNSLFQPYLTGKGQPLITTFLENGVRGKLSKIEQLLEKTPSLLLKKGVVKDYSGRTFLSVTDSKQPGITLLQYAFWAWDRHLWEFILKYLPAEEAAKQLAEFEANGLTIEYALNVEGEEKTSTCIRKEMFYDITALVKAYTTYLADLKNSFLNNRYSKAKVTAAFFQIGQAQRYVPVHVACEYLSRKFQQKNEFNQKYLSRYLTCLLDGRKETQWFPLNDDLGKQFIILGTVGTAVGSAAQAGDLYPRTDMLALNQLFLVRMKEYAALKKKLAKTQLAEKQAVSKPKM